MARTRPQHARPRSAGGSAPRRRAVGIVAIVVASLVLAATAFALVPRLTGDSSISKAPLAQGDKPAPAPSPEPTYTKPPDGPVTFTLVAGGDVLSHGPVLDSARVGSGYNFAPLMEGVRDYVEGADLAICHMEVPVAPPGTTPSGYPVFGAPAAMVSALKDEGWDGCSTASNHSVDRRFAGIVATLDTLESLRMGFAGTARTAEEADSIQFYTVREGFRYITVAHIAAAYGTNGLPVPSDAPWSVNLFDADAEDAQPILDLAQEARDAGADVVIASVHCCVEYRTEPTAAQRSIVEQIAASGLVDLYIGHHAHVPQPIELVPGGPNGDGMWAAYGLGNYLSNQDTQCCVANSNSGVLLTATITVAVDGKVDVGVEWTAITVDRLDKHTMHVLTDIPGGTGRLSAAEVAARHARVLAAVGTQAPERTTPPEHLADAAFVDPRAPWEPEPQ